MDTEHDKDIAQLREQVIALAEFNVERSSIVLECVKDLRHLKLLILGVFGFLMIVGIKMNFKHSSLKKETRNLTVLVGILHPELENN